MVYHPIVEPIIAGPMFDKFSIIDFWDFDRFFFIKIEIFKQYI